MMTSQVFSITAVLTVVCCINSLRTNDTYIHQWIEKINTSGTLETADRNDSNYWIMQAYETILNKVKQPINTNIAKNIILFLGDGMSIPTLKAARIYMGQLENINDDSLSLSFEKFPYVGLSRTNCLDTQVPDSACTATAFLCGVKAKHATLGLSGMVDDCTSSAYNSNKVDSIARWSQLAGKRTGFVTTARVTHATPAGTYAHTPHRRWESDTDVQEPQCQDIAYQLNHGETGSNFHVIMGGGRREFLPKTVTDEEGFIGRRSDGLNLIDQWLQSKENGEYVWNKTSLLALPENTQYLLGLFESNHCQFNLDADKETEPSLEEMTEAAIKVLARGKKGFFLFVESGRIDHAHHETKAHKALDETVELSKAVQRARDITSEDDTLIVVTADHAHVMTISGYPNNDNDIFGIAGTGNDGMPYATLSYANGPSHRPEVNGRYNISQDDMKSKDYKFPALTPLRAETHGGDEVGIFASGPWAHLFTGVIHQHVIPHTMAYAACVGNGPNACLSNL